MNNYKDKLIAYIANLQSTKINFLYFNEKNLAKPQIQETFKEFELNNKKYYIINGYTLNSCYIYNESIIKYIVTIIGKSVNKYNAVVYDASIEKYENGSKLHNSNYVSNVNHGNHMTFYIVNLKTGDVVIKTHKTKYILNKNKPDIFEFNKKYDECNFMFISANMNNFANFECIDLTGKSFNTTLATTYDKEDLDIVKHLCEIIIKVNGGAKDKQKGGELFSSQFIDFLYEKYIKPVNKSRKIESVKVFTGKNKNIVMIYDFKKKKMSKTLAINSKIAYKMCEDESNNINIDKYIESINETIKALIDKKTINSSVSVKSVKRVKSIINSMKSAKRSKSIKSPGK